MQYIPVSIATTSFRQLSQYYRRFLHLISIYYIINVTNENVYIEYTVYYYCFTRVMRYNTILNR